MQKKITYILPFMSPVYELVSPFATTMLRVLTGLMLIPHGYGKMVAIVSGSGLTGFGEFLETFGLMPGIVWAHALAFLEVGGGLLLAVGLFTRPVAFAVVVFMVIASLTANSQTFWWFEAGYEMTIMWGTLALAFVFTGGGKYSLDAKIGKEF